MPIDYTLPPVSTAEVQQENAQQTNILTNFFNYDHLMELLAHKEKIQEEIRINGVTEEPPKPLAPEVIGSPSPGSVLTSSSIEVDGKYKAPNNFMGKKPGTLAYRNELLRFQAENNLFADGAFGPNTKKVLNDPSAKAVDQIDAPPTKGKWVTINKTKRILTIYEGSQVYAKIPVAVGKSSRQTPSGKTSVVQKTVNPYWGGLFGEHEPVAGGRPDNPLGYRWLGFAGNIGRGYGMHGNAAPFSIGREISNGCVRMINDDVEQKVFPILNIGTPVWLGTQSELEAWGVQQSNTIVP